jgi:beta-glucosidase-like glycosyl hydrolase/CubicO group peptidase (beta-lactamase class C family)
MKGKFQKWLIIAIVAILTGVFFQFSIDKRSVSEQDFVFKPSPPPFLIDSSSWADSVITTLTLQEQIAQMFMVPAYPQNGKSDRNRVAHLIKNYHIGGVIFFHGTPEQITELTSYYQSISKIPLLFSIDGEWGPSMRIEKTIKYPRQMMLGAVDDNDLIYQMGREIGKQLRMLGIHVNFAPDVDVNNNPDNPVINSRSFGEVRENVARKGFLYMKGMQDEGIIAVAKHFPGHGDTDKDSHQDLPVIKHTKERLDSIELFPFKALIQGGVGGVMTAHLHIPAFDTTRNLPSTLSPVVCDSLLKKELKFKGLVFTDAMTMRSVSDLYEPVEANVRAIQAGNDMLLMSDEVEKTIRTIERMVDQGTIESYKIMASAEKILQSKAWAVLPHMKEKKIPELQLTDSLNSPYFELTRHKLIERSITLINNRNNILPLKNLQHLHIAAVGLGEGSEEFHKMLSIYCPLSSFHIDGSEDSLTRVELFDTLANYNLVLLSIHSDDFRASKDFGIREELLEFSDKVLLCYPTILTAFTNPYLLSEVHYLDRSQATLIAYENDSTTQSKAAQVIYGAIAARGKLPVTINPKYRAGKGIETKGQLRLRYTIPLEAHFNVKILQGIDSIAEDAISKRATPGCQVLVAKDGMVVWNKSYGYHTYDRQIKVSDDDMYDLASLTKIIAAVPSLMFLEQEGLIDITEPLSVYLPELDTTNKRKARIDDILLHQAGLKSWIPFYQSYLKPIYPNQKFASNRYSKRYPIKLGNRFYVNKQLKYQDNCFSHEPSVRFRIHVADGFYMNHALVDSLFLSIYASEIDKPGKYRYSDLGFYLFCRMIERLTDLPLDNYVSNYFYQPLGATTLGYKPLEKFDKKRIAPTENDLIFRKQIVQGYVHDPGAAMLGGVSGHAGLFSSANDLAKFMQMLLNGGTYGGDRYLEESMIEKYTSCVACNNGNRRGLGFDKPESDTTKNSPAIKDISSLSYGHSGFTGTMVWADPSTGILYIFLSNRVYPDAINNKLLEMNVRTNIQQIVYDALIHEEEKDL